MFYKGNAEFQMNLHFNLSIRLPGANWLRFLIRLEHSLLISPVTENTNGINDPYCSLFKLLKFHVLFYLLCIFSNIFCFLMFSLKALFWWRLTFLSTLLRNALSSLLPKPQVFTLDLSCISDFLEISHMLMLVALAPFSHYGLLLPTFCQYCFVAHYVLGSKI